jgi:hypothetical protein
MKNPSVLRDMAKEWRREAVSHSPGVAKALVLAAELLQAQADEMEAGQRAAMTQPHRNGREPG